MANIRKSFNFRTGLQVDNDNFVVNANGLVGIGTSIPQNYLLNVHGDTRVTGLTTIGTLYSGIGTVGVLSATSADVSGTLSVGSLQVGTSAAVSNLVGYGYTAWITDNSGVGLHTTSKIGVNTTTSPGASDDELKVHGDAEITGTLAAATFSGSGASLTDIPNSATTATNANTASTIVARDGSGNFSAGTITANLTGTASIASSVTSSADLSINSLSAGIVTASTRGYAETFGVGTNSPNAQLHVRKTGISSLQVTSDGSNEAIITLGRNTTPSTDNGQIRFGHGNALGSYPYSTDESLDIINYDTGNLNFYLNPSGLGTAFNWMTTASNRAMVLTQSGNLGINSTSPTEKLDVDGNVVSSGSITGNTIVKDGGTSSQFLKADGSVDTNTYLSTTGNGSQLTGIVTSLVAGSNISLDNATGEVTISSPQTFVGVVTATQGFTSGIGTAVKISVSGSTLTFTVGSASTSLTLL
jgi:hypothetical protein